MRKTCSVLTALTMVALTWTISSAASAGNKTPAKRAAKVPAPNVSAKGKSGSKKPVARTTWRNRQLAPSQERNKQIQDALAAKGYLSSESATGNWDQASIDALKRFQAEQKINSTGKINSLTLIALGLGPKHEAPLQASDRE